MTLVTRLALRELDLKKLADEAKAEFKAKKTLLAKCSRSWQDIMYCHARDEMVHNEYKAKKLKEFKKERVRDDLIGKP